MHVYIAFLGFNWPYHRSFCSMIKYKLYVWMSTEIMPWFHGLRWAMLFTIELSFQLHLKTIGCVTWLGMANAMQISCHESKDKYNCVIMMLIRVQNFNSILQISERNAFSKIYMALNLHTKRNWSIYSELSLKILEKLCFFI